jgi:hypothetical protein
LSSASAPAIADALPAYVSARRQQEFAFCGKLLDRELPAFATTGDVV